MHLLTELINLLAYFAISTISALGYFGLIILMALESMVVPLPSELVMPFAGFLAAQGKFSFIYVVIFSTLGSIIGSFISYSMGKYGGNPLVIKYGKYLFLDVHDLKKTEDWFAKRGERTIFISRFIPVVRHLISIPAGIGKMNIWKFTLYTIIGAGLWNAFLTYLGYVLGAHWESVRRYSEYISITVAILLIFACVFFIRRHLKNKHDKS